LLFAFGYEQLKAPPEVEAEARPSRCAEELVALCLWL